MSETAIPQTSTPLQSPSEDWQKFEPLHRRVADYFNVDVNTEWSNQKNKLDYVIEWAEKAIGSKEPDKILLALHELENRVGKSSLEDRRINHIYRNLRLDSQGELQKDLLIENVTQEITSAVKDQLRKILNIKSKI